MWAFRGVSDISKFSLELGETFDKTPNMVDLDISDLGMARVIEDLIIALVSNGLLALTDLPQIAQNKIAVRQELRTIQ